MMEMQAEGGQTHGEDRTAPLGPAWYSRGRGYIYRGMLGSSPSYPTVPSGAVFSMHVALKVFS